MSVAMEQEVCEPCLRSPLVINGKVKPRIREVSALSPRRELVKNLNILELAYQQLESANVSIGEIVSRFPDLYAFVRNDKALWAIDKTSEGKPCHLTRVSPDSILDVGVDARDELPSDQHPHIFQEIEASAQAERDGIAEHAESHRRSDASLLLGSLDAMADDLEQNGPAFFKADDTRCLAAIVREIATSIAVSKQSSVRGWIEHLRAQTKVYPYLAPASIVLPDPAAIV